MYCLDLQAQTTEKESVFHELGKPTQRAEVRLHTDYQLLSSFVHWILPPAPKVFLFCFHMGLKTKEIIKREANIRHGLHNSIWMDVN